MREDGSPQHPARPVREELLNDRALADHGRYRTTRVFGSLDGLRGLAVMAVVWHHTHGGFEGLPASHRGYLGVDVFFVLSGFLITTLLLREREEHGRIALGHFYARRTLRIFPLYYGLLAALALFFALQPEAAMAEPFFEDLPWYATYTSNWIHGQTFLALTWSLAAEEQFYLTWAPAVRFLGTGALWTVAAILVIGFATSLGALDPLLRDLFGPRFHALEMVQATFNGIALGVLAGWLLHGPRGHAFAARLLGARLAAPAAAMALAVTANLAPGEPMGWPRPLFQVVAAALVVACVVRPDHGLARPLDWRPLARIGVVSYGIYLLHMPVKQGALELVLLLDAPFPGDLFVVTALLTIAAAEVSYRFYERPFLAWKKRFRRR